MYILGAAHSLVLYELVFALCFLHSVLQPPTSIAWQRLGAYLEAPQIWESRKQGRQFVYCLFVSWEQTAI